MLPCLKMNEWHRFLQGEAVGRRLASEKHTTPDFINRLGLLKELHGKQWLYAFDLIRKRNA